MKIFKNRTCIILIILSVTSMAMSQSERHETKSLSQLIQYPLSMIDIGGSYFKQEKRTPIFTNSNIGQFDQWFISIGMDSSQLRNDPLFSIDFNRQIKATYIQQKSNVNQKWLDIPFRPLLRFPFLESKEGLKSSLLKDYNPSDFVEIVIPFKVGLNLDILSQIKRLANLNIPLGADYSHSVNKNLKLQMFFMPGGYLRIKSFLSKDKINQLNINFSPHVIKLNKELNLIDLYLKKVKIDSVANDYVFDLKSDVGLEAAISYVDALMNLTNTIKLQSYNNLVLELEKKLHTHNKSIFNIESLSFHSQSNNISAEFKVPLAFNKTLSKSKTQTVLTNLKTNEVFTIDSTFKQNKNKLLLRTRKNKMSTEDFVFDESFKLVGLVSKDLLFERVFKDQEKQKYVLETTLSECLLALEKTEHCKNMQSELKGLNEEKVTLVYKKFIDLKNSKINLNTDHSKRLMEDIIQEIRILKKIEGPFDLHLIMNKMEILLNQLSLMTKINFTDQQKMLNETFKENSFIRENFFDLIYSFASLNQMNEFLFSEVNITKAQFNYTSFHRSSGTGRNTQIFYDQIRNYISFISVDEFLDFNFDQYFDQNGLPYKIEDIHASY